MPRGVEMAPMARELLAQLLERWVIKKWDKRVTTLLTPSSKVWKVQDRLYAAERDVRQIRYGQSAPLGKFNLFKSFPLKSKKAAIKEAAKLRKLNSDKLTDQLGGKVSYTRRWKKRRSGKQRP
jgi:hypothetical protein